MSNQFHIMKSNRKNKNYVAMFKNGTNIHFGDNRYEDYIDALQKSIKIL